MSTNDTETLFGLPGAEQLYYEPAELYESEIDAHYDEQPDGGWVVEEWTVRPARTHLPSAEILIEYILERWVNDEITEDAYEDWDNAAKSEEVEAMLTAWADRVHYRMADIVIREHRMTLVDGEPYFDGAPLYVDSCSAD